MKTIFAKNISDENESQTSSVMTLNHFPSVARQTAKSERLFAIACIRCCWNVCAISYNTNRFTCTMSFSIVASCNSNTFHVCISLYWRTGKLLVPSPFGALTCLTTTQYRQQQRSDTLAELL